MTPRDPLAKMEADLSVDVLAPNTVLMRKKTVLALIGVARAARGMCSASISSNPSALPDAWTTLGDALRGLEEEV